MERAVHRLQLVLHALDVDGRVHVGLVVLGVPAGLPQLDVRDVRRVDEVVAALEVLVAPVVLDLLADEPALRVPEDEPGARLVLRGKEVELAAEAAVVAALGLLDVLQVLVELFLREEGVPVDALHRGVAFLALPVGLGRLGLELDRLDLLRAREVRSVAEVDEVAHRVALDGVALRLLLDQLDLQGLALLPEDLEASALASVFSMGRFCLTMWAIFFSMAARSSGVNGRATRKS